MRARLYPAGTFTEVAREGLKRKFWQEADPDGSLRANDSKEAKRQYDLVVRAYYARLSLIRANKRAERERERKKAEREGTAAPVGEVPGAAGGAHGVGDGRPPS